MKTILLTCENKIYGKTFERSARDQNKRLKRGEANRIFCSSDCFIESIKCSLKICANTDCLVEFDPKRKAQIFCSHSCSATHHNREKIREYPCNWCGLLVRRPTKSGHCSKNCQTNSKIDAWLRGQNVSCVWGTIPSFIRAYMLDACGNKCSLCGWNETNLTSGSVPLEVDHIDGNCTNNLVNNLRVLCPNCHSLTPTYRSLNRGNGKAKRRKSKKLG